MKHEKAPTAPTRRSIEYFVYVHVLKNHNFGVFFFKEIGRFPVDGRTDRQTDTPTLWTIKPIIIIIIIILYYRTKLWGLDLKTMTDIGLVHKMSYKCKTDMIKCIIDSCVYKKKTE